MPEWVGPATDGAGGFACAPRVRVAVREAAVACLGQVVPEGYRPANAETTAESDHIGGAGAAES